MSDAAGSAIDAAHPADAAFSFPDFGVDAGALDASVRPLPTVVPEHWACRPDFALDRVCDCGCAAIDQACEPAGCSDPLCAVPACDACFDAQRERVTCGAPGAWLCAPSRMHDGVCDCGCGADDPDCKAGAGCYPWGCNVGGCERCVSAAGAWGACPAPAAWTCNAGAKSDGKCDCGCGNLDPECHARSCSEPGCRAQGCEVCRDAKGAPTSCAPSPSWRCSADARSDGVCDCGCGLADVDCAGKGCSEPECDASACAVCHDDFGRSVPCASHYQCAAATYADGVFCDCGCGAADPDCGTTGCAAAGCKQSDCDVRHALDGAPIVPAEWTCASAAYAAADGCDCGCGALDPDCVAGAGGCAAPGCQSDACDRCHATDGSASSCRFACELAHRGSGDGCDCGCGEQDPDCAGLGCAEPDCFAAACERCAGEGGTPLPSCTRSACDASAFDDGACDCGCREQDPDCAGLASCVSPECSAPGCGHCHAADGGTLSCADWYCTLEQQGAGDGCNCGCGALDPDCAGAGCADPGCAAPACVTCRTTDQMPMSCAP